MNCAPTVIQRDCWEFYICQLLNFCRVSPYMVPNSTCLCRQEERQLRGVDARGKQILWNLIVNSFQALQGKGNRIQISTSDVRGNDGSQMVRLEIADNGPGIPEDIREKIFEPFFSTKDYGTGLGLPIIGRIVDCLGGRIEVESTPEWQTIFAVYLPSATMETATREISSKTAAIVIG